MLNQRAMREGPALLVGKQATPHKAEGEAIRAAEGRLRDSERRNAAVAAADAVLLNGSKNCQPRSVRRHGGPKNCSSTSWPYCWSSSWMGRCAPAFEAFNAEYAKAGALCELRNRYADPEYGRMRVGQLRRRGVTIPDLPSPLPASFDTKSFEVDLAAGCAAALLEYEALVETGAAV